MGEVGYITNQLLARARVTLVAMVMTVSTVRTKTRVSTVLTIPAFPTLHDTLLILLPPLRRE